MKLNKETFFTFTNNSISFIEYHWKAIVNITIGLLCLFLIFAIKGCEKKNQLINDLKKVSVYSDSIANSKITVWKDKYGKEHDRAENLVVLSAAFAQDLDSISRLLKVRPHAITATNKSGFNFNLDEKMHVDTMYEWSAPPMPDHSGNSIWTPVNSPQEDAVIGSINFSWSDNWTKINGSIGDGKDSIHITGTDTLKRTDYWKRKWLLGKKVYYSDFTNSNPHVQLAGYKGMQFADNSKKWSMGITAIIGYPTTGIDLKKPSIYFGIGVQRTLFKF
jgi:hypothetical protein